MQAHAISKIDRATAALRLADGQLRDSEKLVVTQRQQQVSVEARTKAGALDPLEAITAQLDLAAAELVFFESQVRVQQALAALVTGLGLLPLALGAGEAGREIEGPMAIVILGGLVTSTALNLLVLPTLALRYGRFITAPEELSSR